MGKMVKVGERAGQLEVIGHEGVRVICRCDCGGEVKILVSLFLSGKRRSCGCGVRYRNYPKGEGDE